VYLKVHLRRGMIVAVDAPSTTLLRSVVPLPRNGVPTALAWWGAPRGAGWKKMRRGNDPVHPPPPTVVASKGCSKLGPDRIKGGAPWTWR
jgi:hypothetical protein